MEWEGGVKATKKKKKNQKDTLESTLGWSLEM